MGKKYSSVRVTLRGFNNITYSGVLVLSPNWTQPGNPPAGRESLDNTTSDGRADYDMAGASYYVIAVIMVYGMSFVMMFGSHIKQRKVNSDEDKQINRSVTYLLVFIFYILIETLCPL